MRYDGGTINQLLHLQYTPYRPDEIDMLAELANMEDIITEICGGGTKWNIVRGDRTHFPSKDLHQNIKVWHYFINGRLILTLNTSEVTKERALLLYGIKKGLEDQCWGLDRCKHSTCHLTRLQRHPTPYAADRTDCIR